jgi:ATP-dependent DNA helicase RecQ
VPGAFRVSEEIIQLARDRFGFEELRPGQAEAIEALVARRRDVLAVYPTGSGKSAIYQIAGLMLPGATVVISPLIALQRDQVESINAREVGGRDAAAVNSHRSSRARDEAFERLRSGDLEFLFLAPEQLANPDTLARLQAADPTLFVIDEAHCISKWGHDFRPDYSRLGTVIDRLGHPVTLALTATASPPVRDEIVERLGMRDPSILVGGFDRPNISLSVRRFDHDRSRCEALHDLIRAAAPPGIVYCATRRDTEEIALELEARGVRAAAYHAGLSASIRDEIQARFMDDKLDVVVATIAFGMGIDKPDVRFIVHHSISESLDAYYQEIGRAGRNGEPAKATLLYAPDDLNLRRFQAASGRLAEEDVRALLRWLKRANGPVTAGKLAGKTELSTGMVERALSRLADVGAVTLDSAGARLVDGFKTSKSIVANAVALQDRHRTVARTRLEMMRQYADTQGCRRAFILGYFGEVFEPPCGACDNCLAGLSEQEPLADVPFPLQASVVHASWGAGQVVRYEGESMTVLFDDAGYRTLSIPLVVENRLLTVA